MLVMKMDPYIGDYYNDIKNQIKRAIEKHEIITSYDFDGSSTYKKVSEEESKIRVYTMLDDMISYILILRATNQTQEDLLAKLKADFADDTKYNDNLMTNITNNLSKSGYKYEGDLQNHINTNLYNTTREYKNKRKTNLYIVRKDNN